MHLVKTRSSETLLDGRGEIESKKRYTDLLVVEILKNMMYKIFSQCLELGKDRHFSPEFGHEVLGILRG
jgi:hypothetical protein